MNFQTKGVTCFVCKVAGSWRSAQLSLHSQLLCGKEIYGFLCCCYFSFNLCSYLKCDALDWRVGGVNEMALVCPTLVTFTPAVNYLSGRNNPSVIVSLQHGSCSAQPPPCPCILSLTLTVTLKFRCFRFWGCSCHTIG